jgi:transposase-like protein
MRAECQHCRSENLTRDGWYRHERQIVHCADCSRFTYLPPGILPPVRPVKAASVRRRPSVEIPERAALYNQWQNRTDTRPVCPRCGSQHIVRHGHSPDTGKARWQCVDCLRHFLTEDHGAFLDRRHSWLRPLSDQALVTLASRQAAELRTAANAAAEAESLFAWCLRFGPLAPTQLGKVRGEIMVSKQDRACLELMVRARLLDPKEVERALLFRQNVLEHFDDLVRNA